MHGLQGLQLFRFSQKGLRWGERCSSAHGRLATAQTCSPSAVCVGSIYKKKQRKNVISYLLIGGRDDEKMHYIPVRSVFLGRRRVISGPPAFYG